MGNLPKPLAKIVLIPLRLTAAASSANAGILKQTSRSGMTTLITSNEEMDDIIKIVKSLEEIDLLIKGASKTIKNEAKGQKGGFLSMLLGKLGASLFENLSTGNGVKDKIPRQGAIRADEGTIRAGQDF